MAVPEDFRAYPATQQALIGMPSLQILGPPSFHRPEGLMHLIGLPVPIARLNFLGREVVLAHPDPEDFRDAAVEGLTSQFGSNTRSGTIWQHEFIPLYDFAANSIELWHDTPEPQQDLRNIFIPNHVDAWMQKAGARLARLERLGALRVKLYVGRDGLVRFDGMPEQKNSDLIPPSHYPYYVEKALQEPTNRPFIPTVRAPTEYLEDCISTLKDRHMLTHGAWTTAFSKLKELKALSTGLNRPPTRSILEILKSSHEQCLSDLDNLDQLVEMAEENILVLYNRESPVEGWIAQTMARLVREEAGILPEIGWWRDTNAKEAIRRKDQFTYVDIDFAYSLLRMARHHFGNHQEDMGKLYLERTLLHINRFLLLQQNRPLITKVTGLTEKLEHYV